METNEDFAWFNHGIEGYKIVKRRFRPQVCSSGTVPALFTGTVIGWSL